MEFATLTLSVFDPFYTAFGWVMGVLYDLVNNYGLVIILFTILIRGIVLLPLNIRSQRTMMKQQAVAPLIQDLKRRYGDDKQRIQQEQMKIYKDYDIKMSAGCLPMILQLLIIIPVYRTIQAPLRYIMQVSTDKIEAIGNYLNQAGLLESTRNLTTNNIPIISELQNNAQALAHVVNEGLLKLGDLVDMSFLGMNLGLNPSISPSKLFGDELATYLPPAGDPDPGGRDHVPPDQGDGVDQPRSAPQERGTGIGPEEPGPAEARKRSFGQHVQHHEVFHADHDCVLHVLNARGHRSLLGGRQHSCDHAVLPDFLDHVRVPQKAETAFCYTRQHGSRYQGVMDSAPS